MSSHDSLGNLPTQITTSVDVIHIDGATYVPLINSGTGAGGSMTTINGKQFELLTDNTPHLLAQGFEQANGGHTKKGTPSMSYHIKSWAIGDESAPIMTIKDKNMEEKSLRVTSVVFVTQGAYKSYMRAKYKINNINEHPDEAYIYEFEDGTKMVRILEKKTQHVSGTAINKILAIPTFKRMCTIILPDFKVEYGICVNSYLKNVFTCSERYAAFNVVLAENHIPLLFGEDADYFDKLNAWIWS